MMPELLLWPTLALAAIGAVLDFRDRRLPNWLCLALAAAALAGLVLAQGVEMLPWALLHAVIALVIGMGLFAIGMIGGGDAKFYAAAASSVPATSFAGPVTLLGWTSVAGLILLIAMMIGRRLLKKPLSRNPLKGWEVPYGVAIAAGLWLTHIG